MGTNSPICRDGSGTPRLFECLFWPRGQELAGWSCAHEAELELVALLSAERVRARIETAEQQLRMLNTPGALSGRPPARPVSGASSSVPLERWRALLAEALSLIYERGDTDYFQLGRLAYSKDDLAGGMCASVFIFALAEQPCKMPSSVLLGRLAGCLAASPEPSAPRKWQTTTARPGELSFSVRLAGPYRLGAAFSSSFSGLKNQIFSATAVNVDWCNPYDPATLAIALLFGFSERLFDGVASQIENKFLRTAPPTPPPSSNKTAPSIVSLDPPKASIGKPVTFTVRGATSCPDRPPRNG